VGGPRVFEKTADEEQGDDDEDEESDAEGAGDEPDARIVAGFS
jgi:hypothetical protein